MKECSPKVTAGTAAVFGGVTEFFEGSWNPGGCCADGPSGIRMDCGYESVFSAKWNFAGLYF